MNRMSLRKQTDSFALFADGQRMFAGSLYEIRVDAPEFRTDAESPAYVRLESAGVELASCGLVADPLRRGLRVGLLPVPGWRDSLAADLRVELGGNTILFVDVAVTGAPAGESGPAQAGGRTEVDLGRLPYSTVTIADMTQARLVSPVVAEPLSVVPASDGASFDVYVSIETDGARRFPFSDVLVAGTRPTWSHQDSFLVPSQKWLLRIVKVAGTYYADLRAGRPGGTEIDPDGAAVVSAEVNS